MKPLWKLNYRQILSIMKISWGCKYLSMGMYIYIMGIQWDTSISDVISQKGTFTNPCFFCQFWIASFILGGSVNKNDNLQSWKVLRVFLQLPKKIENVTTKSLTPYPTWARPPSSTLSQGTKTQTEGPQWGLTFGELDLMINHDKCMDQKPAMCSSLPLCSQATPPDIVPHWGWKRLDEKLRFHRSRIGCEKNNNKIDKIWFNPNQTTRKA